LPAVAAGLDAIARDGDARARFLAFARDADEPAIRARMLALAADFTWLSPAEERDELARMIAARLSAGNLGEADVDLVCSLNRDGSLDPVLPRVEWEPPASESIAKDAVLACLGSAESRVRVVRALSGPREADVGIAQAYLQHRPLDGTKEVRAVVAGVAGMRESSAQVRALETLARQGVDDRGSLDALTRLFATTRSADVQSAIAGILIRSDPDAIGPSALLDTVRLHRVKPAGDATLVDVLVRVLENRSQERP
jgi:hypothetical protein